MILTLDIAKGMPDDRYSTPAIALHWTIGLLILANIPLGLFADAAEDAFGASTMWIHKSLGLTVLLLSLARLAWRIGHAPPPLPRSTAGWRNATSRIAHALLYVLMILVPLTGWVRVSASRYPLQWFGLVDVPKFPAAPGSTAAHVASGAHDVSSWALTALALLHIAAALHHQLILRDGLLRRITFAPPQPSR